MAPIDYDQVASLARELKGRIEVPLIISGGLDSAEAARRAYAESGADAVMIARGSLGNPSTRSPSTLRWISLDPP